MYIVSVKRDILHILNVHTIEEIGVSGAEPYSVILIYNGNKQVCLRTVPTKEEANHAGAYFLGCYHRGDPFYYMDQNAKALHEKSLR